MLIEDSFDSALRRAAADWVEGWGDDLIPKADLMAFEFQGRRIPLTDPQRGIRKPAMLDAALSFTTTYTRPNQIPPYADAEGPDGLLRYKYRGEDPEHPENVAMRKALIGGLPLIWFIAIRPGNFLARSNVYLIDDEPQLHQFVVALDSGQRYLPHGDAADVDSRRYAERTTKVRVHQPSFRLRVLDAYERQCTVCRLKHVELLDAAHILSDGHEHGMPIVPNGLAMCKIHHAAFDKNIIGIRPDLIVEVRPDILKEVDGPMLKHGLQEMSGREIFVPKQRISRPAPDNLAERYEGFRTAS